MVFCLQCCGWITIAMVEGCSQNAVISFFFPAYSVFFWDPAVDDDMLFWDINSDNNSKEKLNVYYNPLDDVIF